MSKIKKLSVTISYDVHKRDIEIIEKWIKENSK